MKSPFAINSSKALDRLEAAVTKSVNGKTIRNAVLHVDSQRAGIRGTWANGVADERDNSPMLPETPFLSASIGKIAMAATAFDLASEGIIELDESITAWIAKDVLAKLPAAGGSKSIEEITVRMLTANRSGLPDYFDSDVHSSADGAPSVMELLVSEPLRTWSREQLIEYVQAHYGPFALPGERFLYSDLNWDLLGLVFEGATQQPFHRVVHERVLDPLGMTKTWYHVFENPPESIGGYADVFAGEINLTRQPCLTVDQAGGGLITTAEDLGKLMRSLADGNPVGLDRLGTDWTEDAMSRGLDYGYGTWRWRPGRIFFAMGGLPELKGVSGSNNSYAYVTSRGDVVTGTMNQADDPSRHVKFVLSKVLPILERVKVG
ncbi:MAG: beta-lactamase family protein [Candidatus Aminicenantes bacterium]|nr:beta-lactamase family protein [Candidatus Aminicenantes bacterium]